METHVGQDLSDYLQRPPKPPAIRKEYGIPTDLSELDVQKLEEVQKSIATVLTAPGERVNDYTRHFLQSEHFRIAKQISFLNQQSKIQELQADVASEVEDSRVREELSSKLDELAETTSHLAEQFQDFRSSDDRLTHELRITESKWRNRMAMLQREPAAVLVGGTLLVAITVTLIIGMFSHTEVPEILASGFLLILGFFFGQNSSRGGSSGDSN